MSQEDTNLENELEEAGNEEEIKSGLKVRSNLKAGLMTVTPKPLTGRGATTELDLNTSFNYTYNATLSTTLIK